MLEIGNFFSINYLSGSKITANLLEVLGNGCFHLNLTAAVAWVYVVKDLLATLACVKLYIAVKELIDVSDGCKLREFQAQVIETGKFVGRLHGSCSLLEALAAEYKH